MKLALGPEPRSNKNFIAGQNSMAQVNIESREMHVPLDKCKIYPGIPMRLEMDIVQLGESIHQHGQLEAGMAIKRNDEYLIPDGRMRLLGCRYSRYRYGGPTIYWALVYEDLDEVQIFTRAFIKNDEKKYFSLLEEINYFREANKRFGAKIAAEIGIRAGRQPDYMREVLEVCSWIGSKLVKLHKIEMITEHRFRLSELEELAPFRSEDAIFYHAAAAVAAARMMNPSEVDQVEIKSVVKYYAPWFERVFPEYWIAPGTKDSTPISDHATIKDEESDAI